MHQMSCVPCPPSLIPSVRGTCCLPSLRSLEPVRGGILQLMTATTLLCHIQLSICTHSTTYMQDEITAGVGFMTFIPLQPIIGWVTTSSNSSTGRDNIHLSADVLITNLVLHTEASRSYQLGSTNSNYIVQLHNERHSAYSSSWPRLQQQTNAFGMSFLMLVHNGQGLGANPGMQQSLHPVKTLVMSTRS